jgi:hypothetical protein
MGAETWVRPYSPGIGRRVVLGWEAVSFGFLGWTTVPLFELTGHGVHLTIAALVVTWALGAWRIIRMGVYVGPGGVRIRGLFRTRTVSWPDVAHIWLHRSSHRIGRWEIPNGLTVLIERHDGAVLNTELWAQGVDFHSRPKLFRAVYHELRDRHLAATA